MNEHPNHGDRPQQPPETRPLRGSANQKKARKKWSKEKKIRVACIVGAVILVLAVSGVVIWNTLLSVRPSIPQPSNPSHSDSGEDGDGVVTDGPRVSGTRKSEDFYTILLVGRDTGGGGNTDTMMLFSYDVTNQKLNCMSLPRDTMVNVPWSVKKLNSVYNANGGGEEGIQALKEEVGSLVGFIPDFYVMVEWEAVGELVDAIGGVWFDVPFRMYYNDPAQDLYIDQAEGYRKLTGDDAMQVVRWRKNNGGVSTPSDGSDLSRIQLQQSFMTAVIQQCLQIGNVAKIPEFARIFQQYVETDLSLSNLIWFGQSAVVGGLDMANVNFFTMPCSAVEYPRGTYGSYVVPNPDELLEAINLYLNPYEEDVTLSQLELMSVTSNYTLAVNSGAVTGGSSGGSSSGGSSSGGSSSSGGGTSTPSPSPEPSPSVDPGVSPEPTPSTDPGVSPEPTPSTDPGVSPEPTPSTDPGVSPEPTPSTDPGVSPEPTPSTDPGVSPEPTPSTDPGVSPEPSPSPSPSSPAESGAAGTGESAA